MRLAWDFLVLLSLGAIRLSQPTHFKDFCPWEYTIALALRCEFWVTLDFKSTLCTYSPARPRCVRKIPRLRNFALHTHWQESIGSGSDVRCSRLYPIYDKLHTALSDSSLHETRSEYLEHLLLELTSSRTQRIQKA